MIGAEKTATGRLAVPAAIDPQWSINELLRRYPSTAGLLNARGIDSGGGGAISLVEAARTAQLHLGALLDALGAVTGGNAA